MKVDIIPVAVMGCPHEVAAVTAACSVNRVFELILDPGSGRKILKDRNLRAMQGEADDVLENRPENLVKIFPPESDDPWVLGAGRDDDQRTSRSCSGLKGRDCTGHRWEGAEIPVLVGMELRYERIRGCAVCSKPVIKREAARTRRIERTIKSCFREWAETAQPVKKDAIAVQDQGVSCHPKKIGIHKPGGKRRTWKASPSLLRSRSKRRFEGRRKIPGGDDPSVDRETIAGRSAICAGGKFSTFNFVAAGSGAQPRFRPGKKGLAHAAAKSLWLTAGSVSSGSIAMSLRSDPSSRRAVRDNL